MCLNKYLADRCNGAEAVIEEAREENAPPPLPEIIYYENVQDIPGIMAAFPEYVQFRLIDFEGIFHQIILAVAPPSPPPPPPAEAPINIDNNLENGVEAEVAPNYIDAALILQILNDINQRNVHDVINVAVAAINNNNNNNDDNNNNNNNNVDNNDNDDGEEMLANLYDAEVAAQDEQLQQLQLRLQQIQNEVELLAQQQQQQEQEQEQRQQQQQENHENVIVINIPKEEEEKVNSPMVIKEEEDYENVVVEHVSEDNVVKNENVGEENADVEVEAEEEEEVVVGVEVVVEEEERENLSDAETAEYVYDRPGDPDYDMVVDAAEEYDPEVDVVIENRLSDLLNRRRAYYTRIRRLERERRRRELPILERALRRIRNRRQAHYRENRRFRHVMHPFEDAPRRSRDFCFGCGRRFWMQRVRLWRRCNDCGFWLCPACADEPTHCDL